MDIFPVQSPPVVRPDLIPSWSTVNVSDGTLLELVSVYMHLTHGANYDDPSPWASTGFAERKWSR